MSRSHSTSRRRLPPLNALCAFEACARLGSTVAAAAELGVTHGAISKQISLLESWLEVSLFDRSGARMAPTPSGAHYAEVLGRALDEIHIATASVLDSVHGAANVVRVSTTASFASLWLLPRLQSFRELHPNIEVWVSESRAPVSVGASSGADVALRMGRGPWSGVRAEPLMSDSLVPVCTKPVAAKLRKPADLARVTLLHDEDPRTPWTLWLEQAGLERPSWAERGPHFTDGALLLQAAASGQGVALARRRLAAELLKSGRLVQPFAIEAELGPAYWLVLPPRGAQLRRSVRTFAAWVRHEAAQG